MAVIINYVDVLFDLIDKYEQGKLDNIGKARFLRLCRWYDNDRKKK